jgi:hypothetical protein
MYQLPPWFEFWHWISVVLVIMRSKSVRLSNIQLLFYSRESLPHFLLDDVSFFRDFFSIQNGLHIPEAQNETDGERCSANVEEYSFL